MLFRVVCLLIILAGSYIGYEIWRQYSFYTNLQKPLSKFTVLNPKPNEVTIVDFINYGCPACRTTSKMIVEYVKDNPEIKLVVRPVPFEGEGTEYAVKMVMAAGLQGSFWEFHDAVINYDQKLDETFFKDTANLYGISYEQMVKDAQNPDIFEMMKSNAGAAISIGLESTPAIMVGKSFYQPQGILTLPELIRMVHFEKTGSEKDL